MLTSCRPMPFKRNRRQRHQVDKADHRRELERSRPAGRGLEARIHCAPTADIKLAIDRKSAATRMSGARSQLSAIFAKGPSRHRRTSSTAAPATRGPQ